ncbi:9012_t:CDS:2 [Gigaspora margarita]|uniref:9012_t:CDS:1 n=1 Tax=Gigaspora margarita TaxID=4874 RepID=A0ABN7VIG6_GIGMA|nr:9012_t:CDS:2 [Gigaspora margarita]
MFNRLKEGYSSLYKQNQRLIADNEHWKRAIEGFAAAVQKNIEDASQKIIEKIDEIDRDDNKNNTRCIDYDEIKRRAKEAAAEALAEVQDFLPNLPSDMRDLLDQMPLPLDNS